MKKKKKSLLCKEQKELSSHHCKLIKSKIYNTIYAIASIGSRANGYSTSNSDYDYIALTSGNSAFGKLINWGPPRIECLIIGEKLIRNFLNNPRTDFIDSQWLMPLCMLNDGKILIDKYRKMSVLKAKIKKYLKSKDFSKYLHALFYRGVMNVKKANDIQNKGLNEAKIILNYAIWDIVICALAAKGIFFRGPKHFTMEIKSKDEKLFKFVNIVINSDSDKSRNQAMKSLVQLAKWRVDRLEHINV